MTDKTKMPEENKPSENFVQVNEAGHCFVCHKEHILGTQCIHSSFSVLTLCTPKCGKWYKPTDKEPSDIKLTNLGKPHDCKKMQGFDGGGLDKELRVCGSCFRGVDEKEAATFENNKLEEMTYRNESKIEAYSEIEEWARKNKEMDIIEVFKQVFSSDDSEQTKYKRLQMGNWHAWGYHKALSDLLAFIKEKKK